MYLAAGELKVDVVVRLDTVEGLVDITQFGCEESRGC
jgi:hypothetical protein